MKNGRYQIVTVGRKNPLLQYANFFTYFEINRMLKRIKPDLIYTRVGTSYVGFAAKYCKSSSCKSIWHIAHQNDVTPIRYRMNRAIVFSVLEKRILEYGIRNVDTIIGQAAYQSELLKTNYGRKCDIIVPNFHPVPKKIEKRSKPVKVVWIASFKSWKRPELFIRLARCFSDRQDVEFIMIGRPIMDAQYSPMLSEVKNLTVTGEFPIEEVNRILSESHVFVNTSEYEGFPNTFIQAWMHKVPVVSLSVDPDNMLKRFGIGFHSGTFSQMCRDVELLIDNQELREMMADKAQPFAVENFSLGNINRITDLMLQMMNR